jgi:hypothetical protein
MAKKVSPVKNRRAAVAAVAPAAPSAPAAPAVKAAAKPKLEAIIDFPKAGEVVHPGHYSIRVTATGATQVQTRVGDGPWTDSREAVGHFWHDWAPVAGEFVLGARARVGKGRWTAAERPVVVV